MADLIERTAVHPFRLNGTLIAAGTVVKLTRAQMKSLVASGNVHGSDADNAEVPVINAGVDHEALDAAAGNMAHAGTGEAQSLGDADAVRAQAAALERQQREQAELAKQAELDAAAKRQADIEAEKVAKAAADAKLAADKKLADEAAAAKAAADKKAADEAATKAAAAGSGGAPAVRTNTPAIPPAAVTKTA